LDALKKPTAARRAFPCWDEPLLKATFAVTMISRADTVNLSNMPAISEEIYTPVDATLGEKTPLAVLLSSMTTRDDEWKVTRFQTTPPMSSYIVAFANGSFEYLEKSVVMPLSGKTVPLRIYGIQFLQTSLQSVLIAACQLRPTTFIKPSLRLT
jgi:aminopeptidase 2